MAGGLEMLGCCRRNSGGGGCGLVVVVRGFGRRLGCVGYDARSGGGGYACC